MTIPWPSVATPTQSSKHTGQKLTKTCKNLIFVFSVHFARQEFLASYKNLFCSSYSSRLRCGQDKFFFFIFFYCLNSLALRVVCNEFLFDLSKGDHVISWVFHGFLIFFNILLRCRTHMPCECDWRSLWAKLVVWVQGGWRKQRYLKILYISVSMPSL